MWPDPSFFISVTDLKNLYLSKVDWALDTAGPISMMQFTLSDGTKSPKYTVTGQSEDTTGSQSFAKDAI